MLKHHLRRPESVPARAAGPAASASEEDRKRAAEAIAKAKEEAARRLGMRREHAKQNEAQAARLQQLEAALRDKEDAWARVDEVADSVRGYVFFLTST